MDPLKKVDKDFVCVPQGLNTFSITTFALEEQDHATLREHLSFHNTFPILAQQSWQHWRSENQNVRFKRIQNTGKSSQGAGAARDPLRAALKGFLSATGDAALSENLTGTSLVQMSRCGKLYGLPKLPRWVDHRGELLLRSRQSLLSLKHACFSCHVSQRKSLKKPS